jgi:hypothetical protein
VGAQECLATLRGAAAGALWGGSTCAGATPLHAPDWLAALAVALTAIKLTRARVLVGAALDALVFRGRGRASSP